MGGCAGVTEVSEKLSGGDRARAGSISSEFESVARRGARQDQRHTHKGPRMKTYAFSIPPVDENYRRCLALANEFASVAGFVQGSPTRSPSCQEFLSAAEPFFIREEVVLSYPGGISTFPRRRCLYQYNLAFVQVLTSYSSSLFDWLRPLFLEDLHLLRPDNSTVLGSVSSEEHAYLRLTQVEAERWLTAWPESLELQESEET